MKPALKYSIIVGILLVFGVAVYILWKSVQPSLPDPDNTPPTKTLPAPTTSTPPATTLGELVAQIGNSRTFKRISDLPVFDFWTTPDTGEVFYLTPEGRVYTAKEGSDIEISKNTLSALNAISPSPNKQKILASFGDPRKPQWGIFDIIDKVWRPLPQEFLTVTWGKNSDQLFGIIQSNRELALVDISLLKTPPTYKTVVRDFRFRDIDLEWIPPSDLILHERPSAEYAGRIWRLDLQTTSLHILRMPAQGLINRFSSDKRFVFQFFSPESFSILHYPALTHAVPLFFSTLPSKCDAFASTVYCFVPQDIPSTVILPDEYLSNDFYSVDDLFAVDIATGDPTELFKSNGEQKVYIDGEHPALVDNKFYFINRYDRFVYAFILEDAKGNKP